MIAAGSIDGNIPQAAQPGATFNGRIVGNPDITSG
jgi:hypothetical protein